MVAYGIECQAGRWCARVVSATEEATGECWWLQPAQAWREAEALVLWMDAHDGEAPLWGLQRDFEWVLSWQGRGPPPGRTTALGRSIRRLRVPWA